MTPTYRWLIVGLGVVLAIGSPLAWRNWPSADQDVSAQALLAQIQQAPNASYSGYAESLGTLAIPSAEELNDVGSLLGERTRLRVWWRSPSQWRVDAVTATGESDLIADPEGVTKWDYEQFRATRLPDARVRLPRTSDLLPPQLMSYLLGDGTRIAAERLPVTRVAGLPVPGIRVTPTDPQSSIDHVDVWADPTNGVALRVVMYAKGSGRPVLTSAFREYSSVTPSLSNTSFSPPPGSDLQVVEVLDLADGANQFAPFRPPATVAGLSRRVEPDLLGVGVYGQGMTQLVAIPLLDGVADSLRTQLATTPTVRDSPVGLSLRSGPLSLIVTDPALGAAGWLIAGTVTEESVIRAAHDITLGLQRTP